MKDNRYVIGISCIGSGVGQSVITSCRLSRLPLYTIGLGTNPFAFGAYECDDYDYTLSIYDDNFVEDIISKCLKHEIDLLIPGRDDEALIYAKNRSKFDGAGIKTLVAGEEIISLCRDKERMSLELNPRIPAFVECYDIAELETLLGSGKLEYPLIAKPRGGFASHGVEIILSENDLHRITSDHIVQELAVPVESDPHYTYFQQQISKKINPQVSEISIQIVLGFDGTELGRMASYNRLSNGVPIEVVPYENLGIWKIIDVLIPIFKKMGFVGPMNIQGRLTKKGFKIFEMNPRFTGITGLRAHMGFNEVEACLRSWLGLPVGRNIKINANRFGIRQTTDKSISMDRNEDVNLLYKQINGVSETQSIKTVGITGATGYLGQAVVRRLIADNSVRVVAVGRDLQRLKAVFSKVEIECVTFDSIFDGTYNIGNLDVLVHGSFARPHCSYDEVAESLNFTNQLFSFLSLNQVPAVINLSSQSVYGQHIAPLWKETTKVGPDIPYAQAKYASELMARSLKKLNPHTSVVSLRVAALSGGQEGHKPVDFLSKVVATALETGRIDVINKAQQLEVMDVRDAAKAISAILSLAPQQWQDIYNIGARGIYSLERIADVIKEVVAPQLDKPLEVNYLEGSSNLKFGMDSTLLEVSTGFSADYTLAQTVESLVEYYKR